MVRSPLNHGPAEEAAQTRLALEQPEPSIRVLNVLVVEDQPDIARVMQALVGRCGHQSHWAPTGPDALKLAAEVRPDVAFVDIGLPGMNGYELAQRVRADPSLSGTYLIALTAYGQQEDRAQSLAAGFNQHLVKPISAVLLADVLHERHCAMAGPS